MKRYLAFAFPTYYPGGGMTDFIGSYDTVDDAKQAVTANIKRDNTFAPRGHIYDVEAGRIVSRIYDDEDGWEDE